MKQESSIIHSKKSIALPPSKFKAAFDIMKIKLQTREQRMKTEGNTKTDQGTCTSEDDRSLTYRIELWSIFGRRDLYFIHPPNQINLLLYANQEICITLIDLITYQSDRFFGFISNRGNITMVDELTIQEPKLFYVTLKNQIKCIYLCLVQGTAEKEEIKKLFLNFLRILWKSETARMCFGCYLDFIHIFVWDSLMKSNWMLSSSDLDIKHNKYCQNSKKKRPQLNLTPLTPDNETRSLAFIRSLHLSPKLVIENKLDFVMKFIKPSLNCEKNRINQICIKKQTLLRPKSSVAKFKKIQSLLSPKTLI